jgi:GDP-fucose protein O-fucosyltransferase
MIEFRNVKTEDVNTRDAYSEDGDSEIALSSSSRKFFKMFSLPKKSKKMIILGILGFYFITLLSYYLLVLYFREAPEVKTDKKIRMRITLEEVCQETVWQKDLYLNCTNLAGGTINVRNSVMTCIRWAVDGGMTLVLPKIATRSKKHAGSWFDTWEKLDYLFDSNNMKQILSKKCPGLILQDYDSTDQNIPNKVTAPTEEWTAYEKSTYRSRVSEVLKAEEKKRGKIWGPVVIGEDSSLWGWYFYKEPIVRDELYEVLQFNPNILSHANVLIDLLPSKFIAIHLRVEEDAGWHTFDDVVKWFKDTLISNNNNIHDIYIAVGRRSIEEKFRKAMENYNVISKWTLASGHEKLIQSMEALKFDQMAIIDFEILKHSSYFYGLAQSSFSFAVAFERSKHHLQSCNCNLMEPLDPYFVGSI